MEGLIILIVLLAVFVFLIAYSKRKKIIVAPFNNEYKRLLLQHVPFYVALSDDRKKIFEERMQHFLSDVRITGVRTEVEDLDKILIAASAIIPTFAFSDWEYTNLTEVLIYPDSFSEKFAQEGNERSILGMVGWGFMQNTMVISQHDLRQGFINKTGKTNTAIHEFVHLVDKTDGATDGIPENIMKQQYLVPWLQLMQKKIKEINKGKSDINPYGATNEAEFFAVVSEYFFERPDLLKEKHPELYRLLEQIFHQQPKVKMK